LILTDFKGKGEVAGKFILESLFMNDKVMEQVPLMALMMQKYKGEMDDRELKETIDLAIFKANGDNPIAIRFQGPEHNTYDRSNKDKIQKKMLEISGVRVVDIWYYDAPVTFKDLVNNDSKKEMKKAMFNYLYMWSDVPGWSTLGGVCPLV